MIDGCSNRIIKSASNMTKVTRELQEQFISSQKRGHAEMLLSMRKTNQVDPPKCKMDTRTPKKMESLKDAMMARSKETSKRGPAAMLMAMRQQEMSESTGMSTAESPSEQGSNKKRKLSVAGTCMPTKRVSFSNAQSVVEVETVTEAEKRDSWYGSEDYSQFVCSAHHEAQVLKTAAECATSAESLFKFIQSNPDLSPRGLEKVMHHHSSSSSSDEDDSDDSDGSMRGYSRKIRRLKTQHRQTILSMHQDQKQSGQHNPEELRKFSEDSSQFHVQTALKLGHIDANGLI